MVTKDSLTRSIAIGAGCFAVCWVARLLLEPVLGPQFGFMFFLPAVVGAAWLGGRTAGLAATALSVPAVWYFWLPPYRAFGFQDPVSAVHLGIFVVLSVAMSHLLGQGRAAKAREIALRQSYEVTLRSIGDAVIATDGAGRITFMNGVAERLVGGTFASAAGREVEQVLTLVDEETRAPGSSPVRTVLAEKHVVLLQNHTLLVRPDGQEIPIADSAAPILTENGELGGVVLVFHDTVEQSRARRELRAANAALRQQIEDLRRLQELSATALALSEVQPLLDATLRAALEVNDAPMGLLSLVVDGGTGLRVAASVGFSEAASRAASSAVACGACLRERQRIVIEDVAADPRFDSLRAFVAEAGFRSVHSTPLITRDGRLIGVLTVNHRDARRPTERQMQLMDVYARSVADLLENVQLRERAERELANRQGTEEELRITNERFRLAAHGDVLTLFEQDHELRYRWIYPQRPDQDRAIGRTDAELLPPDDASRVEALKRAVLTTGEMRRAEVTAHLPGGSRVFDLTVLPKRDAHGAVIGVAGAAIDITHQKAAEQRLLETQAEIGRANAELERRVQERTAELTELVTEMEAFSYSVSHDLRSPLRGIMGFAEALQEDYGKHLDGEGQALLGRIMRGAQRMNALINDVLAYSRVNRERIELAPVALQEVVAQVMQHAPELQPPRANIRVPLDLPVVLGMEVFVTQVIANLLGNAVKFVPSERSPVVELSWERRGDKVRLWIADNGIGIKPEHRERLFGMFERLNASSRYEGTGMGLAIVRRAVMRMGGAVGVESEEGQGSRFWIELQAATT
jgi:PAS domain S-box-containing protein